MFETVPADLLSALRERHAEPQRHYHDWTHIEALGRHLDAASERIHDREAVLYAILFPDAVYDPKASDHERRSAALLLKAAPPIAPHSLQSAHTMIMATEGHALPESEGTERSDIAHFLDMDLGILGAPPDRFDLYEDQIRKEYAHVPEEAFRKGRAAVLRRFADREQLYFSQWGRERFEQAARANIARSLKRLAD